MSDNFDSIVRQWIAQMPAVVRYEVATEDELANFESKWGVIPADYRKFLFLGGGGAVGAEWLDGIAQLNTSHAKYSKERGPNGWSAPMFLIGWDGSGAPIGIDERGGVIVEHEGGETTGLAPSLCLLLQEALS